MLSLAFASVLSQGSNVVDIAHVQNTPTPEILEPRDYLKKIASEDFYILDLIVKCESGWKPWAKNPNSTASGLFQFIGSTWSRWSSPSHDVFNPYDNIDVAYKLYKAQGTSPWNASKTCWTVK